MHTPGPWKFFENVKHPHMDGSHNNRFGGGYIRNMTEDGVGKGFICDVRHRNDEEAFANARLLEAAPELLRILEDAVTVMREHEDILSDSSFDLMEEIEDFINEIEFGE